MILASMLIRSFWKKASDFFCFKRIAETVKRDHRYTEFIIQGLWNRGRIRICPSAYLRRFVCGDAETVIRICIVRAMKIA